MSGVSALSQEFLLCRAYGHAWRPTRVSVTTNTRNQPVEFRPHLMCDRCETFRVQILSPRGEIGGNRYSYPEGYAQKGKSRFDRQDVRLEVLNRSADDMDWEVA